MSKNPNPQGKGGSLVLATLDEQRLDLATVPPKQIAQVATELFTSLFVLDSEFRFKPMIGKPYFLYRNEQRFWLGLTPPTMLGDTASRRFIGRCILQPDMTWTLELAEAVAADPAFMAYLEQRRAAFEKRLSEAARIDDVLPVHERRLPFYQRAFAFAVAHSLRRSMAQAGIGALSYDEALGRVGQDSPAASH